jgi:hypothetical protein
LEIQHAGFGMSIGQSHGKKVQDLIRFARIGECRSSRAVHRGSGDARFGSKPEKLNESKCFPLFTQQRTSPRYFGISASCQQETHALQKTASLFDHLVGTDLTLPAQPKLGGIV